MFDRLEKHHLGFIISKKEQKYLEKRFDKTFTYDSTQETHVLFVYEKNLKLYIEYICQEGRVKNHKLGFAHTCYSLENFEELSKVEVYIKNKKLGFRLTELEKSGSKECGYVTFYFLKHYGVVELNLISKI